MTVTLEEIQCLADLATPPDQTSAAAWERLRQLREELMQIEPGSPTPTEILEADRRERDASLRGQLGADDVHP